MDLVQVIPHVETGLAKRVNLKGGRAEVVGPGIGIDLSTQQGYVKAFEMLKRLKPKYLYSHPPDKYCWDPSVTHETGKTKCEHMSNMICQNTVRLMRSSVKLGIIPVCVHPVSSTYWHAADEDTIRAKNELPVEVHRDLCLDDLRETTGYLIKSQLRIQNN